MSVPPPAPCGVRIAGVGSAVPPKIVTNKDLEKILETSDEWIAKRTGIRRRHVVDPARGEGEFTLARDAIAGAIADSGRPADSLDMLIHASVSSEMTCPSNACRIAAAVGATPAAAFDLVAACSGFVYGMNLADTLIRSGRHERVGVVGCDAMSTICDFEERSVSILFGDAAGGMIFERDDDPNVGCLFQRMGADGSAWESLYLPRRERDVPESDKDNAVRLGYLRMNGREVFRFAVTKFREVIEEALEATGLAPDDVSQFICHQSNVRIIESAVDKLGLPPEKVYVNIDEYGNSSAGSVPLAFHELWRDGRVNRGDKVVFVAFGGGLTWASSVWQL